MSLVSSMAKPMMSVNNDLSLSKVMKLLDEANKEDTCHVPPAMPKSGEVYVYEPLNDYSKSKSNLPLTCLLSKRRWKLM